MASSLSQRGRIRMLAGELESARHDLRDARGLASGLGMAGGAIVQETSLALRALGGA